jgi:hypothetical protein
MRNWLSTMVADVRSWFGWENIDEARLSPEHGWLLPRAATVAATHPAARANDRADRSADRR